MSSILRSFARGERKELLARGKSAIWNLQTRNVGDLPVKTNKHIEAWATYREHVEDTFTFDPKTLAILSLTLVAFPVTLYNIMTKEYSKADDKAGRPRKEVM